MKGLRGHTKLLSLLVIAGSLIGLASCGTNARYSEHQDFGLTVHEDAHPSSEWYPINNNNASYFESVGFTEDGYTPNEITYHKFYLEEDITISSNLWIQDGDNVLCLNGYSINVSFNNNSVIWMDGGNFELCDCQANGENGGTISGGTGDWGGGGIHVAGGTLTMNGGIICDNNGLGDAGGIYVNGGATLIMNDGYIIDNTAMDNSGNYVDSIHGGGVYVADNGTFTMNGGTIRGNYSYDGGGIYIEPQGVVNIYGGYIMENYASYSGAGIKGEYNEESKATINMKDTPYVAENYLTDGTQYNVEINSHVIITLTGDFNDGASVGVSSTSYDILQITSSEAESGTNYRASALPYFFSDTDVAVVRIDDTDSYLILDTDGYGTVLTDFTLKFYFTYNGEPQTVPDWGVLYVEGDWNEWTLEELLPTGNEGEYYITIDSIMVATHSCEITLDYTGQTNLEHLITIDGDLSFRIPGSSITSNEYTVNVECYAPFTEILEDPSIVDTNVVFVVYLQLRDTEGYVQLPDWIQLVIQLEEDGSQIAEYTMEEYYDEETGNYCYYYVIPEIHVYTYEFDAYLKYNDKYDWATDTTSDLLPPGNEVTIDIYEYDDEYTVASSVLSLDRDPAVSLPNLDPSRTTVTNFTLQFALNPNRGSGGGPGGGTTGSDDIPQCPSWGYLVVVLTDPNGNTETYTLTEAYAADGHYNYSATFDELDLGTYTYMLEFRYNDDQFNWGTSMPILTSSGTFELTLSDANDGSHTVTISYSSIVDMEGTYPEPNEMETYFESEYYTVEVNNTVQTELYKDQENATVTYESSDPDIATVDANGVVTGIKEGTVTITATVSLENYNTAYSTTIVEVTKETFKSFTYHITLYDTNGDPLGYSEKLSLFVAGTYNGTWNTEYGGYWDWGAATELTWNEELETYDLVLDFIPDNTWEGYDGTDWARSFNVYWSTTGSMDDDDWGNIIGSYEIGTDENDQDAVGVIEKNISVSTDLSSWNDVTGDGGGSGGSTNTTTEFYVVIFDYEGNTESTLDATYTTLSGGWNGGSDYYYFDGSDTTSFTAGETADDYWNQPYLVSGKGTAEEGYKSNFWFTSYHDDWADQLAIGGYMNTIPDTSSGTVAVFCLVKSMENSGWNPWAATSGVSGISSGWVTDVPDIETFFSSYITGWVG